VTLLSSLVVWGLGCGFLVVMFSTRHWPVIRAARLYWWSRTGSYCLATLGLGYALTGRAVGYVVMLALAGGMRLLVQPFLTDYRREMAKTDATLREWLGPL
jgi:hypothetical protein